MNAVGIADNRARDLKQKAIEERKLITCTALKGKCAKLYSARQGFKINVLGPRREDCMSDAGGPAIYMKYGTIKGDATQIVTGDNWLKGGKLERDGWVNISDFKWNVDRQITTRAGSSNTRDPKHAAIKEFYVKKEAELNVDAAARCDLLCHKGVSCTIIFVRTAKPGKVYLQYFFSNVFITHIDLSVELKGRQVEVIQMNFAKVEMAFSPSDEGNCSSGLSASNMS